MTALHFTLPESFEPAAYLPFAMRRYHDAARWFISTILTKIARRHGRKSVRLHAAYLKRMMGDRYSDVIGELLDAGAVTRAPYKSGASFAYSLGSRFIDDRHKRIPVSDLVMIKRIQRQRDSAREHVASRFLPVHFSLLEHQRHLTIDGNGARRCLAGLPQKCNPYDAQGIQIRDIEEHRWRFNVGRFGRVTNNVTSMKRELRPFLRIDGEPIIELDIIAAQPSLLALLIKLTHLSKLPNHKRVQGSACPVCCPSPCVCLSPVSLLSPCYCVGAFGLSLSLLSGTVILSSKKVEKIEFARFCRAVLEDDIYDMLADSAGLSRDDAKHRFIVDILAKDGGYPSAVEDAFRKTFPGVHRFIKHVNRDHHATLIRTLQRLEAWVVIELACGRITSPVLTIHDAVYAPATTMPAVEGHLRDVLQEVGIRMQYRVDGETIAPNRVRGTGIKTDPVSAREIERLIRLQAERLTPPYPNNQQTRKQGLG